MRKLSVVFGLMLLAFFSFSQTEKGRFLVGGSLTGSYDVHTAVQDPRWQNKLLLGAAYPKVGYFVCKNFVVGAALVAAFSRLEQVRADGLPNTTQRTKLWGGGIFGRYYYRWARNGILGELYYSYDFNRDVYESYDWDNGYEINRIKYNGQNNTYHGGLGYTRFITEKIGLEIMAHYRYRYDHATVGHNNFAPESFSNGVSLLVGFQVYL
jgi:hypothetical protein